MTRRFCHVVGALLALATPGLAATPPVQDVSGIWWSNRSGAELRPLEGGAIPFTAAGLETYRKNQVGLKDGSVEDAARKFCVPDGVPRILATRYPFQLFQSPGFVTFVYEQNHVFRTVPLDPPVPKDEELVAYPYYSGNSFGHWEGDTLVIVTKGFNEKTFVDASGVPHSDQLRVTERLRKINGGSTLEDIATIEDTVMFAKPWSTRFVYDLHPDMRIDTSYTCGEKHRDIPRNLPRAAAASPAGAPAGVAPDLNGFWTHGFSLGFDPPSEGGPGPVVDIKGKPAMRAMGQFLIYEGDGNNPVLQPWVAAAVKKRAGEEKRGVHTPTKQEICFPSGVPNYWTHPLMMQVVQTKDYVVFLHARDHQIRIIHLNKAHVANPALSWYGDSVGHFEGDTLVVDTAGLNDKTPVDVFNTPHTAMEHVVERIRVIPGLGGQRNLQVRFTVDDAGAFTTPWTAIETYRSAGGPGGAIDPVGGGDVLQEEVCAENNRVIGIPDVSIPTATAAQIKEGN